MRAFFTLLFALIIPVLSSCSFFRADEGQVTGRAELARQRTIDNATTDVGVEPFSGDRSARRSDNGQPAPEAQFGVELTWDMPAEPTDGFAIFTGESADKLNTEIRVPVSALRITSDNRYQYIVKPVSPGTFAFVAIAAMHNGELSERSAPQKIETYLP